MTFYHDSTVRASLVFRTQQQCLKLLNEIQTQVMKHRLHVLKLLTSCTPQYVLWRLSDYFVLLIGRGNGFGKNGVDEILGFLVVSIDGNAPGGDRFVIELGGIFGKGNPVVEAILGLFRSRQVHKN